MIKKAYTLAEVLITLGIIGIVAAITIPALINKYKSVQLKSQLNKAYSTLTQAVNMIYADTGMPVTPERYNSPRSFVIDLKKYLKVAKDCGTGTIGCVSISDYKNFTRDKAITYGSWFDDGRLILEDGTLIMIENVGGDSTLVLVHTDINGPEKGPNAMGHDLFTFQLQNNKLVPNGASGTYHDIEIYPNYCSFTSTSVYNGLACTYKALTDDDYFKNLP